MRYVVVVHGIGEQRKNETVLAVVDRFAEAHVLRRYTLPGAAHLHHLIHTAKRNLRAAMQPDYPAYASGEDLEIPARPEEPETA